MKFLIDRWKTADQHKTDTLRQFQLMVHSLTCPIVVAVPAVLDEIMAGPRNNVTVQL